MNYHKHYNLLMERGKDRELDGYTEKHHIVPRCMGGSNDLDNLVVLTPEEHYVAHQLLVKMYPEHSGLVYAAVCMTKHRDNKRYSNKLYGWLKRKHAKSIIAENNPFFGKKHSKETIEKMTKKKQGEMNAFFGKKHSKETIEKMSNIKKSKNNPNFGKMWINNGIKSKMVYKIHNIPNGWQKGRII